MALDGRVVHLDAFDPVVAFGRSALRQELQPTHAVAPYGAQEVECLDRARAKSLGYALADGGAVGQQVVEVVLDGWALQGLIAEPERQ